MSPVMHQPRATFCESDSASRTEFGQLVSTSVKAAVMRCPPYGSTATEVGVRETSSNSLDESFKAEALDLLSTKTRQLATISTQRQFSDGIVGLLGRVWSGGLARVKKLFPGFRLPPE